MIHLNSHLNEFLFVPCHYRGAGTTELQAILGFLVQWTYDLVATLQERVLYIPTQWDKQTNQLFITPELKGSSLSRSITLGFFTLGGKYGYNNVS